MALIRPCIWEGWSELLLVTHTTLFEISCCGSITFSKQAFNESVTGKGMRHSPIKNGNVTSFFAMDAPRSLSEFYDHFRYEIGEYEIG